MIIIIAKDGKVWNIIISRIMISMDTHRKEVFITKEKFPSPVLELCWDIHKKKTNKNRMSPQDVWLCTTSCILYHWVNFIFLISFLNLCPTFIYSNLLNSICYILNLLWIYPMSIRFQKTTLLKFQLSLSDIM